MKTVTLAEVRDRLPELIRNHTPGTQLRVTDGETEVAVLTVSRPLTPEEDAADQARRAEIVRQIFAYRSEKRLPPPEGFDIDELFGRRWEE
jgi:antitoxin (DNA-binding transcriptional repressor) of toxin-antitoxin stability system